jgi:hypothetical protein
MRDDDPGMGIEKRSDQAVAGSRVTDKHAIGLYAVEKFRIAPVLQQ